jgi:hypothetical protein
MNGHRLILASDVLDRDGLGLELYDPDGRQVAEIFRDDETGTRTFTSTARLQLDPAVLRWFLAQADDQL